MSFYSLWQHYISMTSQPLGNSDTGVMRIIGITELMRPSRLSPSPLTHYTILYSQLSHPNLSKALAPSSFFLVATPRLLKVALYFLFISCCLLLVPHLVILKYHSLYHSLKSSLISPASVITPCPNDCAKTQECLYLSLSFFLFSCADMTRAHPETVPSGQSCETVSLTLKPLFPSDIPLPQYLWTFPAAFCVLSYSVHWNIKSRTLCCFFKSQTCHLHKKKSFFLSARHLFTICFPLKLTSVFTQMSQGENTHWVVKETDFLH